MTESRPPFPPFDLDSALTKVQAAEMYMKREKTEEAKAQLHELATAARQAYSDVRESIVGLRALPAATAKRASGNWPAMDAVTLNRRSGGRPVNSSTAWPTMIACRT